ncbi:MAG: SiaB family protein kinase [Breznakibacter sp.]
MVFDLKEWHSQKQVGDKVVDFMGEINPNVISGTLEKIEVYFDGMDVKGPVRKKVYNVVVECFQNLYHHSDVAPGEFVDGETYSKFGTLMVVKDGTFYRITTGNFIKSSKQLMLKDRIDQLNSLSDMEIKTLYRDILGNDEYSNKGGGGLGMLDIVRKTGNKLEYQFFPANSEHVFFTMDVYIS